MTPPSSAAASRRERRISSLRPRMAPRCMNYRRSFPHRTSRQVFRRKIHDDGASLHLHDGGADLLSLLAVPPTCYLHLRTTLGCIDEGKRSPLLKRGSCPNPVLVIERAR